MKMENRDKIPIYFAQLIKEVLELLFLLILILSSYFLAAFRLIYQKERKSLKGEIILITGSGSGIGRQICFHLANSNAKLILWDINKKENEKTVKTLRKLGTNAYSYVVDIGSRSQIEVAASRVRKEVGDVSILINNAGVARCHNFLDISPTKIQEIFNINVLSHFWTLRAFLPSMISKGRGHIVTMCSIAGLKPNRYMVPYQGSKYAIHGYIESLKAEMKVHPKKPDIKFTTVYPHAVNTRLLDGIRMEFRFPWWTPIQTPEEVAAKLVDGLRRDKEYVYCPWSISVYLFLEQFIPLSTHQAVTDYLMTTFEPERSETEE